MPLRFDFRNIKKSYVDRREGLVLPEEPSVELAEFLGILAGDGHVGHHPCYHHSVEIAGHKDHDREYYHHVKRLFVGLFNVSIRFIEVKGQKSIKLKRQSKGILSFLEAIGYHKVHCIVTVPQWIWQREKYTRSFFRGLFDTDGSLALKNDHRLSRVYPVATISLKDKCLVDRFAVWVKKQDLRFYLADRTKIDKRRGKVFYQKQLDVGGYKNVGRFMDLLQLNNPTQTRKWEWARGDLNPQ